MIKIITEGNTPIEVVEPFGVGFVAFGIAIRQVPSESLETETRTEIEAVVWKNIGRRNATDSGRESMGAAVKILDAGDERLALRKE